MRAVNHVLTGSVFAAATVTHLPVWVILPAAFLLHFVLDALPHYGDQTKTKEMLNAQKWMVPVDGLLGAIVLAAVVIARPDHWPIVVLGGMLCASPDLWSARRFFDFLKTGDVAIKPDWFSRWHAGIQWDERPWGIWVELVWAIIFGYLLWQYL